MCLRREACIEDSLYRDLISENYKGYLEQQLEQQLHLPLSKCVFVNYGECYALI